MYRLIFTSFAILLALSVCGTASPVKRDAHNDEQDRPGQASDQIRCDIISGIPPDVYSSLGLNSFYSKYTHAYNIPVLGSSRVSDQALQRACYVVSFMLADRRELRQAMYAKNGRVAIMATDEVTLDIPEHSFLPESFNTRARGLGGTLQVPVSTGAEENVLCLSGDRYYQEDILVHELAHGIHLIALKTAVKDFDRRLTNAYNCARKRNLWMNTYANVNVKEYFAEGTQSFFNVQRINNNIATRDKLASHDPALYSLIREVFPCENNITDRCVDQGKVQVRSDKGKSIDSKLLQRFFNDVTTPGVSLQASIAQQ